jgi:hypothetical protein
MKWFISVVAVLALAGCATPIPFSTLTLGGEPTVTSNKQAALFLISGATVDRNAEPIGFRAESQSEFIEVLRTVLLRLEVFQAVAIGDPAGRVDVKITVTFNEARYSQGGWAPTSYWLDVTMKIEGGKAQSLKQYRVSSNEGLSTWQSLNINAYEAKARAARMLLEMLVPDIRAYVAENA